MAPPRPIMLRTWVCRADETDSSTPMTAMLRMLRGGGDHILISNGVKITGWNQPVPHAVGTSLCGRALFAVPRTRGGRTLLRFICLSRDQPPGRAAALLLAAGDSPRAHGCLFLLAPKHEAERGGVSGRPDTSFPKSCSV